MPGLTDLHPYQRTAVKWILDHPRCALFLDMGLGKTIITLTAIDELMYNRHEISRVLVVAPLRVARDTWADELEQWSHVQHLSTSIVLGTPTQRTAALHAEADIYITSRDLIRWVVQQYTPKSWPFDMLVLDELSSFKSAKSQRFKALKKVAGSSKRVVGLTGTPTSNGLEDLWSQLFLIDGGERLGRTLTRYREEYFWSIPMATFNLYKPKPDSLERVTERISDICLSMQAKDYLDLPPVQYIPMRVTLSSKTRRAYDTLRREMLLTLPPNKAIPASNAAVLAGKLKQMTGGAIYDDEGGVAIIHSAKIDALKEIVELADDNILVAYEYRHEAKRIQAAIPTTVPLGSEESLGRWCRGEVRVGLANAQSLGHGLNLQRGGSIIVWFSLPWSLEIYKQFNARLARQGQDERVRVIHLIARETIDERVMQLLRTKQNTQTAIIEAVRAELMQ